MENYILYNGLMDLSDVPLNATKALLDLLHVKVDEANPKKKDIGYNLRYYEKYFDIFKPTLEFAKEENKTILALENSSHLALKKANDIFEIDAKIKSVNDVILQNLKNDFTHFFDKFNLGIYFGSDDESLNQDFIPKILNHTKVKIKNLQNTYKNDGYFLANTDEDMAYKMAGDILFDAFDSGCDFLVVNDIRSFYFFDNFQKQIAKKLKRPLGEAGIPILFTSQVLLMAYGKVKKEENFTNLHKVNPNFI